MNPEESQDSQSEKLTGPLIEDATPSLAEIATLVRWNIEEAVRELEMGNSERARARLTGLVQSDGAAYQVERGLKGG